MIKTLASISVAWLLAVSCQSGSEGFSVRKGTIGTGALGEKRFADNEFLCASLTADAAPTAAETGEEDQEEASAGGDDEVTIVEQEASRFPLLLLADPVSYDGKVKGLLAAQCVGCHKPGGTPPDLSTYETAKASGDDSQRTIVDESMPTAGPLSDAEKATFKAWVDGGYLKSSGGAASGTPSKTGGKKSSNATEEGGGAVCQPPSGASADSADGKAKPKSSGDAAAVKATYAGGIKALLDAKCNACHKAGGTPPDLTSYDLAKDGGPASLLTIEDDSMPPSKPLAADQKTLFKQWADAGYPEK